MIQDESEKAAQRSRRPRRRSPKQSSSVGQAVGNASHTAPQTPPRRPFEMGRLPWLSEPLPRHLQPKAEDVAVSRFFANYVLHPRSCEGDDSHLPDLPLLYSKCEGLSILRLAVDSCSLASFANAAQADVFRVAARVKYGQALQALQIATTDPELAASDQTLMAILVLEYYSVAILQDLTAAAQTH